MTQTPTPIYPQPQPAPQPRPAPVPGTVAPQVVAPSPYAAQPMPAAAPVASPYQSAPMPGYPMTPPPMPVAPQQQSFAPPMGTRPAEQAPPPPMGYAELGGVQHSPYAQPAPPSKEGGERALPAISIQAFCERSETAGVVHEMSRDWRMKRTNLKIFMGGLPAAIEYYHKETTPGLILVESGMRGPELFAQLEQLASVCDEGTQLIMIGAANDIKLYRQLIDQGVSDYIVPPFHPLSMIRSISDIFTDPEKPFIGRSVAFFGAKGGVGSSTLAHNVAWCMSEQMQQETALIDLDASWGTTGLDFAYDTTEGLEEALAQPDRLDETLLDRIMLRHTEKLSILPSSSSLGVRPNMSSDAYEAVVNGVRSISPMTILDMPHFWCDWTSKILTNADEVVITASPDLANLRNAKNLVEYLKAARPNDAEPILVVNKLGISKTKEIPIKQFSSTIGLEPALVIPFDPDSFIEAAVEGKMLTDVKTAAQTVGGLNYLAQRLKTGEYPIGQLPTGKAKKGASATGEKKSLFDKLRRK